MSGKFLPAVLFLAILLPGSSRAAPPSYQAHILVQAKGAATPVNRNLLGQNVMFAGNGMWDTRTNALESEAASYIKRLSPPVLRFPGGSLADLYIWEDGLGELTTTPITPATREITLTAAPSWPGVTRIRLVDRLGGKYGDLGSFLCQEGTSLKGVKGFKHTHPAGGLLRPELRPGQHSWHSNSYGIMEHLQLCESLPAQPILTVNCGSGLLPDGRVSSQASLSQKIKRAAAWVAFVNGNPGDDRPLGVDAEGRDWHTVGYWARQRLALGHPLPYNVLFWEIGNEIYDRHEVGHCTARQYAADFVQFAQAMKRVDPNVKIGAVGLTDPAGKGDGDGEAWNPAIIRLARDYLDFLIIHPYYPSAAAHQVSHRSRAWFSAVMGAASQVLVHLQELRAMLAASTDRASDIKLMISEYGIWPAGSKSGPDYSNLAGALFDADLLLTLAKHQEELGVSHALAWNLHGNTPTAAIKFDFGAESRFLRPQFFVFELLRHHLGPHLVPVQVRAPVWSQPRVGNVSFLKAIPCLQALAASAPDRLSLLVLNRSLDQNITASIMLQDSQPRPPVRIHSLHGPSPAAHNDLTPCQIMTRTKEMPDGGSTLHYTFPAHSLTVLEFQNQADTE